MRLAVSSLSGKRKNSEGADAARKDDPLSATRSVTASGRSFFRPDKHWK